MAVRRFTSMHWVAPIAVTAIACGMALAPGIAGATVNVSAASGVLEVNASGPGRNMVDIRPDRAAYHLYAPSVVVAGPGCVEIALGDVICSGDVGSVRIDGSDGPDVIDLTGVPLPVIGHGGAGGDALVAGTRAATLDGGAGDDQLTGGTAGDRLDGGEGDDLLEGAPGPDTVVGGAGDDVLRGQRGDDIITGDEGRDLEQGGAGADSLSGNQGADALVGGDGANVLSPGTGGDTVFVPANPTDALQCQTALQPTSTAMQPCADVKRGPPPASWPPSGTSAAATAIGRKLAWVVVALHATAVRVHIPARTQHRITVRVHTYDINGDPLRAYCARTHTKHYPKIRHPRPPRSADTADVTLHAKQC